jgi:hypothetical protein
MTTTKTKKNKTGKRTMIAKNPHTEKPKASPTRIPPPPPTTSLFPSTVDVIAVIGMEVECTLGGFGPHYGTIIHIEPDACIVRLDEPRDDLEEHEEESRTVIALQWKDVLLTNVRPAQAQAPESSESKPPITSIPIGARVEINVNDGNQDRPGTLIYAHPECGVVKLDEMTKDGNSFHTAADWDQIYPLEKGPFATEVGGAKAVDHAE